MFMLILLLIKNENALSETVVRVERDYNLSTNVRKR
jgi:hypothetical protein